MGLIGGSIARVLKNRKMARRVIGAGRSKGNMEVALKEGVIDEALSAEVAVKVADFVVLCPPVLSIIPMLESLAPHIKPGALVTDGGSTKKEIAEKGEQIADGRFTFIGSHPIAGTEKSGAAASFETLFDDHKCIITPTPATPEEPLAKLMAFWKGAGMDVVVMDPARHDEILGAVSHLPHLAAYALTNTVAQLEDSERLLDFAAGGFRDTTRIAASPAEMWADISLANRGEMIKLVEALRGNLEVIEKAIRGHDREALIRLFAAAAEYRRKLKR